MPEKPSSIKIQTQNPQDISTRLFDKLVVEQLDGKDTGLAVEWIESEHEDGEPRVYPMVTVRRNPALTFVARMMSSTSDDDKLIMDTGLAFEEKVAANWKNTMDFYTQLSELGPVMDALAIDPEAGFIAQARQDRSENRHVKLTNESLAVVARQMACTAFKELFIPQPQSQSEVPYDQDS